MLRSLATLAPAALIACATMPAAAPPSTSTTADAHKRVEAMNGAVTSANALASDAGLAMLRAGGNAIDAAVATSFAIGVVEPQMSGLGGSGSMLIWLQAEAATDYLDFYAAQHAPSFHGRTGDAARSPDMRIVAVPGMVAGLLEAHARYGTLPIETVMAPAIRLAEDGFPIGQILAQFIVSDSAKLHQFPASHTRMWPNGVALPPGAVIRNPQLARTLRAIAARGRAGFYQGDVASAVVAAMNAGGHPITLAAFDGYEPQWKRPLCATYRGRTVLSAAPPQTGAQLIHTLKLLEPHDLPAAGLPTQSARAFDILVSALRVAMTDNRSTNDDPRWRAVPAHGRTTEAFAALRRPLVGTGRAPASIETVAASPYEDSAPPPACAPLDPWTSASLDAGSMPDMPAMPDHASQTETGGETTHISVVDASGNAVALTQTNSTTFGSGAWVEGFFLNDSGYRFSDTTVTAPAGVEWRTRTSTIAPTIVLEDGRVRLVTGAPGAGRIPTEIVQTMVYVLDYGMDPLAALKVPRVFPSPVNRSVQLEHGFAPALLREIREMGYDPVAQSSSYARLYMIVRQGNRWIAVADPRHDGEPRGY
ncbi:MAG TPA: gamma-glutamyltransferase family protein [Longimicrobiales bacterium]|nr:gamma-glutamyltransferase family protein [Longimicrobiales bacterium]